MERFVKGDVVIIPFPFSGSLSFIRPLRIFTADKNIILRKAGKITPELMNKVIDGIIFILKHNS